MRLIFNLILLTCIPSLLGWLYFDYMIVSQLLKGTADLFDIVTFCLGNWGWYTLIKCSMPFYLKNTLQLKCMDYSGLFAGALAVIIFAMQALENGSGQNRFSGARVLLYIPPLLLAIFIYKIAKKSEPKWILLKK